MSGPTLTSARQIVDRDVLQQLFPYVSGQLLDLLLRSVDLDLTMPLRANASSTPNLVVTIDAGIVNNTISGRQKSIPFINNLLPIFTTGTITFPSADAGTITVSPGSNITLSCPSGNYVKILISLDDTGNLVASQGTYNSVEASALVPSPVSNTFPICYISIFNNSGTIQNISQNHIFQFDNNISGTSGGSGTVTSVDITVPAFLSVSGNPITTSGTLALTLSGSALPVANGGTGDTSFSANQVIVGGTTSTGPLQQVAGGTTGQALISNGPTAAPTWQNISSDARDVQFYIEGGLGHGSTNTTVRTFNSTNGVRKNSGTAITYTPSTVNGDSFVINVAGTYIIGYGDTQTSPGNAVSCITVNGTALSTNASTPLTYAQGKRALVFSNSGSNVTGTVFWAGNLSVNDIIRAQDNGVNNGTSPKTFLWIQQLSTSAQDEIYLDGGSGYGSTNLLDRSFTTVQKNTGTKFTYTSDASLGDYITINTAGMYLFGLNDPGNSSASSNINEGITQNDSSPSTNISSMTYAQGVREYGDVNNVSIQVTYAGYFNVNDVVRVKSATGTKSSNTNVSTLFWGVYLGSSTSSAYYQSGNLLGSFNTGSRNFSSIQNQTGVDVVAGLNAYTGGELIVNTTGLYIIGYSDISSGQTAISIAINGRMLTTPVAVSDGGGGDSNVSFASRNYSVSEAATAGFTSNVIYSAFVKAGDIISAHRNNLGTLGTTDPAVNFWVARIS